MRICGGHLICDLARPVARSIVHHDDLIVWCQNLADLHAPGHRRGNDYLFVICRQHDRDPAGCQRAGYRHLIMCRIMHLRRNGIHAIRVDLMCVHSPSSADNVCVSDVALPCSLERFLARSPLYQNQTPEHTGQHIYLVKRAFSHHSWRDALHRVEDHRRPTHATPRGASKV